MFSVSPEIYSVLSQASRWLFIVLALMLLFLAFSWHGEEMAVPLDDQSYLLPDALTADGQHVDVMIEFDED